MVQILFAILAGILTIGAPCILPVLPVVLGNSLGQYSKTRPIFIALGFIVTFASVSLLFSAFVRVVGISQDHLRFIGIILLFLLGLFLVWPLTFEKLSAYLSVRLGNVSDMPKKFSGNFGGFMIGLTLGLVWTPCAGPVLGAILTLIATSKDFTLAAILLFFYAIGAGIPMMVIAYGGQLVADKVRAFSRYSGPIQQIFGALIILLAVAMYFKYDLVLQAKIIERFPSSVPKF
ncbi:MAG TPA: cytochrome c biogenesis CcdA family protein [Patescibacteria group bacterium]|jgi:cytochrome c biogenesis protein CcdA|nr:cytochrome c biogenesis CcdA family protein [Patescibacteria group bacterium]